VVWPVSARPQEPGRIYRLGVMIPSPHVSHIRPIFHFGSVVFSFLLYSRTLLATTF
jgi:hypothetical protein